MIDLSKWALIGYKDETGLGRMRVDSVRFARCSQRTQPRMDPDRYPVVFKHGAFMSAFARWSVTTAAELRDI